MCLARAELHQAWLAQNTTTNTHTNSDKDNSHEEESSDVNRLISVSFTTQCKIHKQIRY